MKQRLTNEELLSVITGQTAIISTLINALISSGALQRNEIVNALYETLAEAPSIHSPAAAPFKHLLNLLED
ncbi:hypothetical protein EGT36_21515 [Agrobacterium sp. FDAARGOS_525]|nr:hypothetical protein EGT36_21515 [Agrobacterium sp. FDAARGOS_525]